MKLQLERFHFRDTHTIGKLAIGGVFEAFTLEDCVREPFVKVDGKTAIPAGTYGITVNMSNRFQRMMPLLVNVPHFAGIRIHPGNTAGNTEGCILVGLHVSPEKDRLLASRIAFDGLFNKLDREFSRGQQIEIEITDRREAVQ